jgi:hypothetical protein
MDGDIALYRVSRDRRGCCDGTQRAVQLAAWTAKGMEECTLSTDSSRRAVPRRGQVDGPGAGGQGLSKRDDERRGRRLLAFDTGSVSRRWGEGAVEGFCVCVCGRESVWWIVCVCVGWAVRSACVAQLTKHGPNTRGIFGTPNNCLSLQRLSSAR